MDLPVESQAPVSSRPSNPASRAGAIERMVDRMIASASPRIGLYVERIRLRHPGIGEVELATRIIRRKAFKNGLVGAATGLGGFATMPVMVPADLLASWRIQIAMIIAIAHVFGRAVDPTELKTDVLVLLAGGTAKEALKRLGIEVSKTMTRKAVQKEISQEVMAKVWVNLGRKIAARLGRKSVTRFRRSAPLIGAPIGFAFDWYATREIGRRAIRYYSSEPDIQG